jgi:hypothetical protein
MVCHRCSLSSEGYASRTQVGPHPSHHPSLCEFRRRVNHLGPAGSRESRIVRSGLPVVEWQAGLAVASKWTPKLVRQVSANANFSSNIPMGCIDSRAKRRYSLAQIPNLVAYTNPRSRQAAEVPGPAVRRAFGSYPEPTDPKPTGSLSPIELFAPRYSTLCFPVALAQFARGADVLFIYSSAPGAALRGRKRQTSKIKRAGGRQIL